MTPVQIPFDIPVRQAFDAEDYLVTSSNREAVCWIDLWPKWSDVHCSILYGEKGCGKTHLTHVWQQKSNAHCVTLEDLDLRSLGEEATCLIIEDVDESLGSQALQEKLFHLYNWQKQYDGFLLMTARQHPKQWNLSLADLTSRMMASISIEIGLPDDELLEAVIVKQFMDRQILVPQEVVKYILPRIERSFEAAQEIVNKVDNLALIRKRKITVPLVRDLFE